MPALVVTAVVALAAVAGLAACGSSRGAGVRASKTSPARSGMVLTFESPALRALIDAHWDWRMRRSPVFATTLGDHRFDDRLPAVAHGEVLAEQRERRDLLERAAALAEQELPPGDRLTLDLLIEQLEGRIGLEVCEQHLWSVSAYDNAVTRFNLLPSQHEVTDAASAEALLQRYRLIPRAIDDMAANLRQGLARGKTASAESVRRAVALIDGQLAAPIERWALIAPARAVAEQPGQGMSDADRQRFAAEIEDLVASWIRPALERYRDLLRDEILPAARVGEQAGLASLPDGKACYRALIRRHIGLDRSPEALHRLGLAEIEAINAEMVALGRKLFGAPDLDLAAIVTRLRTDRALYFDSADQIMAAAREALGAARARVPEYFGVLPRTDCVVVAIPDYEAPYTTIAYYRTPHADGSKPGEYFINTYAPETRPRFEMQVLAFHEAIPGHHLQLAIAQERSDLPAFQRHGGNTALVEGWALYTERLADEMGLYGGDLDRMGMLSYDAWRAARLVVDTGIHAMGWTRERAEQFMREHTALTESNIRNEVDRYITTPGQALAYKIGQLEIRRLREKAERALLADFDVKGFHDVVLQNGAVTLPVLEKVVDAWIAAELAAGR